MLRSYFACLSHVCSCTSATLSKSGPASEQCGCVNGLRRSCSSMIYEGVNRAVSDSGNTSERSQYSLFPFRRGVRRTASRSSASKESSETSSYCVFDCELGTEVRTGFYSNSGSTSSRQYAFHPALQLPTPTQSINVYLHCHRCFTSGCCAVNSE